MYLALSYQAQLFFKFFLWVLQAIHLFLLLIWIAKSHFAANFYCILQQLQLQRGGVAQIMYLPEKIIHSTKYIYFSSVHQGAGNFVYLSDIKMSQGQKKNSEFSKIFMIIVEFFRQCFLVENQPKILRNEEKKVVEKF